MASDADDPTYGSSARVVYSVLDGEIFFTVDRNTGKIRNIQTPPVHTHTLKTFMYEKNNKNENKNSNNNTAFTPKST